MTRTSLRLDVPTLLTIAVATMWCAGWVVRALDPSFGGQGLDAAMTIVLGYWFISKGLRRNDGNGS